MPKSTISAEAQRSNILEAISQGIKAGRPIVPMIGAGASIEAGAPPLAELTRYLAKTKTYIRHEVFRNQVEKSTQTNTDDGRQAEPLLFPFSVQPQEFLRDFGWPDPNELNSDLWHWLKSIPRTGSESADKWMDIQIEKEIFRTLADLDLKFILRIYENYKTNPPWGLSGSYWKLLLHSLTQSNPDLTDTLFRRLLHRREPGTAHRYLAFLTPTLRIRLFLTINFDTLLEDALRIEGFKPTIYEIGDGVFLPHHRLVREGISVVKLHGGAHRLLVGDKLDTPLDEETRTRLLSYLPENLILLVLGVGGWDRRVLEMISLVPEKNGEVWWLHFEDKISDLITERFSEHLTRDLPDWFHTERTGDPGAFLRELHSEFKSSHPSGYKPYKASDLRPIPLIPPTDEEGRAKETTTPSETHIATPRIVIFEDDPDDYGLGSALTLSKFVASKSSTHQPVWIDLETKFTVEDVVTEILVQLRKYDPGLPPEIIAISKTAQPTKSSATVKIFRKVVRRLYAAFSRGRYIVAFNGLRVFGRSPIEHHGFPSRSDRFCENMVLFQSFLAELLDQASPDSKGSQTEVTSLEELLYQPVPNLGILDSMLAFSLGQATPGTEDLADVVRPLAQAKGASIERPLVIPKTSFQKYLTPATYDKVPILLSAFRVRRSKLTLLQLMRFLELEEKPGSAPEQLDQLIKKGFLWLLEGREYWMSRRLRNEIYDLYQTVASKENKNHKRRREAQQLLFSLHNSIYQYYMRELYPASQDTNILVEAIYHLIASLRYLQNFEASWRKPSIQQKDGIVLFSISHIILNQNNDSPSHNNQRPVAGELDGDLALQLRLLGLRSLRSILQQEYNNLLIRVPSLTLQTLLEQISDDFENFALATRRPKHKAIAIECEYTSNLLDDLVVDILMDMRSCHDIHRKRRAQIAKIVANRESNKKDKTTDSLQLLIWLAGVEDTHHYEDPTCAQLISIFSQTDTVKSIEIKVSIVRYIFDCLFALRFSVDDPKIVEKSWSGFDTMLNVLLERWELASRKGEQRQYILEKILELQIQHQRLLGERELWGQSPWDVKGKNVELLDEQQKAACNCRGCCDKALSLSDSVQHYDPQLRSRIFSLKGRALYLLSEFEDAYRDFDLARADLSENNTGEGEALAIALLRKAECLMVHSDEEISQWAARKIEEIRGTTKKTVKSSRLISTEGARKNTERTSEFADEQVADDKFRSRVIRMIRLSLANANPELLDVIESCEHLLEPSRPTLANMFEMIRSRLAAAQDLLDRAELLLEEGRRNSEWWFCLFQLKAQLAVERLLLLLAGDTWPMSSSKTSQYASSDQFEKVGSGNINDLLGHWLAEGSFPRPAPRQLMRYVKRMRASKEAAFDEKDHQKLFINYFQGLLRQGLVAIRQGMDIILPSDLRGDSARIERNRLLNRHLRLWIELMICGAHATEVSQRSRPAGALDDNIREHKQNAENLERWNQWCYLNQISGITTLAKCDEVRNWFLARSWLVGPPSLSTRARVLARMDLCLANEKGAIYLENGQAIEMAGAAAIHHLRQKLVNQ